jgi:cell wall assembly regulator SMI1
MPHQAPEAWPHELFAPLAPAELAQWEQHMGGALPPALRAFYCHHDGLNLFSCAFALHG